MQLWEKNFFQFWTNATTDCLTPSDAYLRFTAKLFVNEFISTYYKIADNKIWPT